MGTDHVCGGAVLMWRGTIVLECVQNPDGHVFEVRDGRGHCFRCGKRYYQRGLQCKKCGVKSHKNCVESIHVGGHKLALSCERAGSPLGLTLHTAIHPRCPGWHRLPAIVPWYKRPRRGRRHGPPSSDGLQRNSSLGYSLGSHWGVCLWRRALVSLWWWLG